MIKITLPDGSSKEYKKGVSGLEIAKSIGERLAQAALAIEVNGKLQDMSAQIEKDAKIRIITFKDKEGVEVFRHSTAHLLANAVVELFPEAKITIGPVVDEGFYYDIDHAPFTPSDLEKIEKKMKEIVDKKIAIERKEFSKQEALKIFKDNPYKVEIIKEVGSGETVSAYQQGKFIDLCRGPHVPNTSFLKAFKLTKLSSAYWRGDAKNKSLQRIYGISFPDKKDLDAYVKMIEEAAKHDHRVIGKNLDLFSFSELSPGSPFFHPKGTVLYNNLLDLLRGEYKKRGFDEVITPVIFNKDFWTISGHWEHFKENMFMTSADNQDFSLKPMNCPAHCLMFKTQTRSYKDLPWRLTDFGVLHRNEVRGALGGLTRARKFSQDDGHIFCTSGQIQGEIEKAIDFINYIYKQVFKFEFDHIELSTKPEKALGDPQLWVNAEAALQNALNKKKIKYVISPGEGAFYGPKIDFHVKDALGRTWQTSTIQLDFNMPKRFELFYDGEDGKKHNPVMIHRAILGSLERFMGVLIEHYAGRFPLWLNPNQVAILPIADRHIGYAESVALKLSEAGIRAEVNTKPETTPKKVRDAQMQQFNYILVVGDKEQENHTVNVRTRDEVVHGEKKVDVLIKELMKEIDEKK